jgi:mono/diheme cytochrome c family protein
MTFPHKTVFGPAAGAVASGVMGRARRGALPVAMLAALAIQNTACRQDMHDAPRYEAYEASAIFPDGRASRSAPANTVARGWLRDNEALYTGKVDGQLVDRVPFALTTADLRRGQERFTIYCTPCHGQLGDGNGMVVQRGLRQAANFHHDRLRQERIGYLFDVMTNGFGAMQSYAEQVPVRDRWLIAAYVRALQYSQNASLNDVPADRRATLDSPPGEPRPEGGTAAPPSGSGQPRQQPEGTRH